MILRQEALYDPNTVVGHNDYDWKLAAERLKEIDPFVQESYDLTQDVVCIDPAVRVSE